MIVEPTDLHTEVTRGINHRYLLQKGDITVN